MNGLIHQTAKNNCSNPLQHGRNITATKYGGHTYQALSSALVVVNGDK
jgi:hypothetical protein